MNHKKQFLNTFSLRNATSILIAKFSCSTLNSERKKPKVKHEFTSGKTVEVLYVFWLLSPKNNASAALPELDLGA